MRLTQFVPDWSKESEEHIRNNMQRCFRELEGLRVALGSIQFEIQEREEKVAEMATELARRAEKE